MDKFELLELFCASQLGDLDAVTPVIIAWQDQLTLLWPEAQRFAGWQDVAYTADAEASADEAIVGRARDGEWPRVSPGVGRVITARLTQALAVIQTNDLASDRAGVTMPSGLTAAAQTSALLIYWCYAMELPLVETGGTAAGQA